METGGNSICECDVIVVGYKLTERCFLSKHQRVEDSQVTISTVARVRFQNILTERGSAINAKITNISENYKIQVVKNLMWPGKIHGLVTVQITKWLKKIQQRPTYE